MVYSNARKVLDRVREGLATKGESPWHFIEIMACPGGCVGGVVNPMVMIIASRARRGLLFMKKIGAYQCVNLIEILKF
jgi:NADH-quinone oxidoreductase subunit G